MVIYSFLRGQQWWHGGWGLGDKAPSSLQDRFSSSSRFGERNLGGRSERFLAKCNSLLFNTIARYHVPLPLRFRGSRQSISKY